METGCVSFRRRQFYYFTYKEYRGLTPLQGRTYKEKGSLNVVTLSLKPIMKLRRCKNKVNFIATNYNFGWISRLRKIFRYKYILKDLFSRFSPMEWWWRESQQSTLKIDSRNLDSIYGGLWKEPLNNHPSRIDVCLGMVNVRR